MNIELIKAILHVLDPAVDAPILSEAILPPSEDALQYLAGHAAKCFASDEAKACTLADDSAFLPLLWNIEDDFEKKTAVIAGDWFRVMQENPAIPAGDAAFLLLEIDGAEYLAALKLNYKPGWLSKELSAAHKPEEEGEHGKYYSADGSYLQQLYTFGKNNSGFFYP